MSTQRPTSKCQSVNAYLTAFSRAQLLGYKFVLYTSLKLRTKHQSKQPGLSLLDESMNLYALPVAMFLVFEITD